MLPIWCAFDTHVVRMWYPYDMYMIPMWCACDTHVVCMWYPCYVCVIYRFSLQQMCHCVVSHVDSRVWNLTLLCTVDPRASWFLRKRKKILVMCMWYPCGVHVIPMWCACDTHVVCTYLTHMIWSTHAHGANQRSQWNSSWFRQNTCNRSTQSFIIFFIHFVLLCSILGSITTQKNSYSISHLLGTVTTTVTRWSLLSSPQCSDYWLHGTQAALDTYYQTWGPCRNLVTRYLVGN